MRGLAPMLRRFSSSTAQTTHLFQLKRRTCSSRLCVPAPTGRCSMRSYPVFNMRLTCWPHRARWWSPVECIASWNLCDQARPRCSIMRGAPDRDEVETSSLEHAAAPSDSDGPRCPCPCRATWTPLEVHRSQVWLDRGVEPQSPARTDTATTRARGVKQCRPTPGMARGSEERVGVT